MSTTQQASATTSDPTQDAAIKESAHEAAHDVKLTPFTLFRYVGSICLLIFSIILVGALIFTGNTRVASEANPWVALIVCILAVVWLSMIEGQQASLVGLPPVDPDLYKDSHPLTYKNAAIAFKGDNLDRYLMGRQFMVLLVVFVINSCASPLDPYADVLGMPDGVKTVFLDIGLGMIIFTCILGQLTTQVNASHCMIDYINNYFALFTLYTAMFIEFTGVMVRSCDHGAHHILPEVLITHTYPSFPLILHHSTPPTSSRTSCPSSPASQLSPTRNPGPAEPSSSSGPVSSCPSPSCASVWPSPSPPSSTARL
mgnify:CR=1 FL=1